MTDVTLVYQLTLFSDGSELCNYFIHDLAAVERISQEFEAAGMHTHIHTRRVDGGASAERFLRNLKGES